MTVWAKTELECDWDDISDEVTDAIQEALERKGVSINARNIHIANPQCGLAFTPIRGFKFRMEGDIEV